MPKNLKKTIFLLLFLLSALPVFTQADTSGTVYVIREIEFSVDGITRDFVLMQHGEFSLGERINGSVSFYRYLALKTQLLNNQRVLDFNYTRIEYTIGEAEADGALPVSLLVFVRDSSNFIIMPEPRYSSNDGFTITLKLRNYNFLGTMTPLRFDLGYRLYEGENIYRLSFDINMPFQAGGLDWNLLFDNTLTYQSGDPLNYTTRAGISLHLPWRTSTFSFGANQFLFINSSPGNESIQFYGVNPGPYDPYTATELFASYHLPLGMEVGEFGALAYTLNASYRINYPILDIDVPQRPVFTITNTLGFGRINWISNLRSGLDVNTKFSYSFNIDNPDRPSSFNFNSGVIYHHIFSEYFGLSSQLKYRQWWRWSIPEDEWETHGGAGDVLRGVLDNSLEAFQMLSFSLDLSFMVLRFWPSEWFNSPGLSFFNFEFHLNPFADFALVRNSSSNFSFENMIQTLGLEIMVFSGRFRSFSLRASFGYNLNKIRREGVYMQGGIIPLWDEVYIGFDRAY